MKRIFFAGVCLFVFTRADAQTWAEWFRQKKTQRKYLLEQIAALQVYLGYARKGYEIAGKGIATVRNIKNGDFNIYRDFLGSLEKVNPAISRTAKVADIIAYQIQIIKQNKRVIQSITAANYFTPAEIEHCKRVIQRLLEKCMDTIDELVTVITSDVLQMADDERLERIDRIYLHVQDKFTFCRSFGKELTLLAAQRRSEQVDVNVSKTLNGIK